MLTAECGGRAGHRSKASGRDAHESEAAQPPLGIGRVSIARLNRLWRQANGLVEHSDQRLRVLNGQDDVGYTHGELAYIEVIAPELDDSAFTDGTDDVGETSNGQRVNELLS